MAPHILQNASNISNWFAWQIGIVSTLSLFCIVFLGLKFKWFRAQLKLGESPISKNSDTVQGVGFRITKNNEFHQSYKSTSEFAPLTQSYNVPDTKSPNSYSNTKAQSIIKTKLNNQQSAAAAAAAATTTKTATKSILKNKSSPESSITKPHLISTTNVIQTENINSPTPIKHSKLLDESSNINVRNSLDKHRKTSASNDKNKNEKQKVNEEIKDKKNNNIKIQIKEPNDDKSQIKIKNVDNKTKEIKAETTNDDRQEKSVFLTNPANVQTNENDSSIYENWNVNTEEKTEKQSLFLKNPTITQTNENDSNEYENFNVKIVNERPKNPLSQNDKKIIDSDSYFTAGNSMYSSQAASIFFGGQDPVPESRPFRNRIESDDGESQTSA